MHENLFRNTDRNKYCPLNTDVKKITLSNDTFNLFITKFSDSIKILKTV
jgi:hypothetical protein